MEVEVGRAARAALDDKAAAEQRVAGHRRRHRLAAIAVLVVILIAEVGYVGYHRWFGPPSLAVGTHATVTMTRAPGEERCVATSNPANRSAFEYGGVWWEPLGFFPTDWGPTGPWKGILTITGPVRSHAFYQMGTPTGPVANGTFTYRGSSIPLAAPPYLSTGPIC